MSLLFNALGLFFLALFIWVYREIDREGLFAPFLPLFLLSAGLACIRPGFRVDVLQRTVSRYWGFHLGFVDFPFYRSPLPFDEIEAVALRREIQTSHRGGRTSRRTVYPVELVTRTGAVRVSEPIVGSSAEKDAALLARMIGVPLRREAAQRDS